MVGLIDIFVDDFFFSLTVGLLKVIQGWADIIGSGFFFVGNDFDFIFVEERDKSFEVVLADILFGGDVHKFLLADGTTGFGLLHELLLDGL